MRSKVYKIIFRADFIFSCTVFFMPSGFAYLAHLYCIVLYCIEGVVIAHYLFYRKVGRDSYFSHQDVSYCVSLAQFMESIILNLFHGDIILVTLLMGWICSRQYEWTITNPICHLTTVSEIPEIVHNFYLTTTVIQSSSPGVGRMITVRK